MKTIITGGESWMYVYDSETKAGSSEWMMAKKSSRVRSDVKVMLAVFIVHHEYAPDGESVNKE